MLAVIWSLASSKTERCAANIQYSLSFELRFGSRRFLGEISGSLAAQCLAVFIRRSLTFPWLCIGICVLLCVSNIMWGSATQRELALDFVDVNQRTPESWWCCLIADCLSYVVPLEWHDAVCSLDHTTPCDLPFTLFIVSFILFDSLPSICTYNPFALWLLLLKTYSFLPAPFFFFQFSFPLKWLNVLFSFIHNSKSGFLSGGVHNL